MRVGRQRTTLEYPRTAGLFSGQIKAEDPVATNLGHPTFSVSNCRLVTETVRAGKIQLKKSEKKPRKHTAIGFCFGPP